MLAGSVAQEGIFQMIDLITFDDTNHRDSNIEADIRPFHIVLPPTSCHYSNHILQQSLVVVHTSVYLLCLLSIASILLCCIVIY